MEGLWEKKNLGAWCVMSEELLEWMMGLVVRIPAVTTNYFLPNWIRCPGMSNNIIANFYLLYFGRIVKLTALLHTLATKIISRFVALIQFLSSQLFSNTTAFIFTHLFKAIFWTQKYKGRCGKIIVVVERLAAAVAAMKAHSECLQCEGY